MYTDNNHLTWNLGGSPFESRTLESQPFNFQLGKLSRQPKSWKYEFEYALRRLVDNVGSKLDVLVSGGADSEVLVRGLLNIGVVPTLHTILFKDGLNAHETDRVDTLSKLYGVKVYYHDHDIVETIKSESYLDQAKRLQCSQIAYLTVVDVISRLQNPAVMGGEVYLQKHQVPSLSVQSEAQQWAYIYREDEDGMTYRYSKQTGHTLVNEIMTYTPELLYSWLTHPVIVNTVAGNTPGKITILSLKSKVYEQELGYELTAKIKYHGYEMLGWTNRSVTMKLKGLWPKQQTVKWDYFELLKHLESGLV